ncbi:hypothetical protein K469DRAFT_696901 [Zopfia rhizophila CBS 207.26]|uniref:BTB domain-containing protein n=1 Tax=Zopfia rhizophila CBS 207.26 TaxID=1314779 RepID=A0A6A6EJI4_9PEZI|nr:hypothetical protein K469DRAFT_696901 [Zopfia rhizophila CBS 207.26]
MNLKGPAIEVIVGKIQSRQRGRCRKHCSVILPAFRAACERNSKDGLENRIKLSDDEPEAFALFAEWIYQGQFTLLESNDPNIPEDNYAMHQVYEIYAPMDIELNYQDYFDIDGRLTEGDMEKWSLLWDEFSDFRNGLFSDISKGKDNRDGLLKPVESYVGPSATVKAKYGSVADVFKGEVQEQEAMKGEFKLEGQSEGW